jgi:hypothetical protein
MGLLAASGCLLFVLFCVMAAGLTILRSQIPPHHRSDDPDCKDMCDKEHGALCFDGKDNDHDGTSDCGARADSDSPLSMSIRALFFVRGRLTTPWCKHTQTTPTATWIPISRNTASTPRLVPNACVPVHLTQTKICLRVRSIQE